jgi:hypothetical protein
MLRAMSGGKAGRIRIEGTEYKISWRKVFKEDEDPLTAAVFSRLSYLPSDMAWRILCRNACPMGDLRVSLGELDEILFWPRQNAESLGRGYVEPDVILNFEHGTVLVEVKKSDSNLQKPEQWAEELAAYAGGPELNIGLPVYFLAIGGIECLNERTLVQRVCEAKQIAKKKNLTLPHQWVAVGCSLQGLRTSVEIELESSITTPERGVRQIFRDILLAFDLYGLRSISWLAELPSDLSGWPRLCHASVDELNSWLSPLAFAKLSGYFDGMAVSIGRLGEMRLQSIMTLDKWRVSDETKG